MLFMDMSIEPIPPHPHTNELIESETYYCSAYRWVCVRVNVVVHACRSVWELQQEPS